MASELLKAPEYVPRRPLAGLAGLAFLLAAATPGALTGPIAPQPTGMKQQFHAAVPPPPPLLAPAEAAAEALGAQAVILNDRIPLQEDALISALPYRSQLSGDDRLRAVECLAAAAWYEAGNGANDQRAVMQVVLNRVRHPSFPNSVCEVVFQGSERPTGCQFTFTCDGSLAARRPGSSEWGLAQSRAAEMLEGEVYKGVGTATHYHADYVTPYWAPSLVKIAIVNHHLFYRWGGYWGERAAFGSKPQSREPLIAALGQDDPSTKAGDESEFAAADGAIPLVGEFGTPQSQARAAPQGNIRAISVDGSQAPGRLAIDALKACGGERVCLLAGWRSGAPAGRVTPDGLAANPPDFLFVQIRGERIQRAWWNCSSFNRPDASQCLPSASQIPALIQKYDAKA